MADFKELFESSHPEFLEELADLGERSIIDAENHMLSSILDLEEIKQAI